MEKNNEKWAEKRRKGYEKQPNLNFTDGIMPPQAIELEEAVLGALMIESNTIKSIADILAPGSFYKDSHNRIYSAILKLYKKSLPVDILTVTQELKDRSELDIIGGAYAITILTNRVASSAHSVHHAKIVSEKYLLRELIKVCTKTIGMAYEDGADVSNLLDSHEKEYHQLASNLNYGKVETMPSLFNLMVKRNELLLLNKGISGVSSGLPVLDKITGGWQKTELIIIAARPSMGKTAFATTIARNAAIENKKPTVIFSLEMSSLSLATRLFAGEADMSTSDFIRRGIESDIMETVSDKCSKIIDSNLYIDDTPGLSLLEFRSKARKMKQDYKIELIIIDYLQLMRGDRDNKNGNREQEIASISRGLKETAKELDIPVITLSQLSRAVETRGGDKRPQLSDLRESGAIEQDADVVMFIHRPEYYQITEDANGNSTAGVADVITSKNRNGPTGDSQIRYIAPSTKFIPLEPNPLNRIINDFTEPRQNNLIGRNDIEDHVYT